MEILNYKKTEIQKSYVDFKASMDAVVERVEEGFVQIGYYLKIARDTQVLQESGYKSVTDFAAAEYGLDKSAVSRFIAINDRFAEDGYSNRLKDQYRGMGRAKLSVMLLLPEEITEELTPDYSKSDIQKIKDEVEEEKKVTDLEVMMEQQDFDTELLDNSLKRAMYQLGHDIPELHRKIWNVADMEWVAADEAAGASTGDHGHSGTCGRRNAQRQGGWDRTLDDYPARRRSGHYADQCPVRGERKIFLG